VTVYFTNTDPDREVQIRELLGPVVAGVEFDVARYSYAELLTAKAVVTDRWFASKGGWGDLSVEVGPSIGLNRVTIGLTDIADADRFGRRLDIPPPYDIYCILPYAVEPSTPV
jgi:hypothetical protein